MISSFLPVNLVIADDHQLITDGIARILEDEKNIGKIYVASEGQEAINLVLANDIDCVIMDINMPGVNGFEATLQIRQLRPAVKILVVSVQSDPAIVSKMLRAGADAFINKDTGKMELLLALQKVMSGEKYISPKISQGLFMHLSDHRADHQAEKRLTAREIEIVRHIADGLTNRDIAEKLFLSPVTVNTHRKNILAKLQLKNTASLVRYAAEHNLL